MFGIGGFELFIIVLAIFLLFGPDKLPEFIKLAGAGIRKFRAAKEEMDSVLHEEIIDPVMQEANKPNSSNDSLNSNEEVNHKTDEVKENHKDGDGIQDSVSDVSKKNNTSYKPKMEEKI